MCVCIIFNDIFGIIFRKKKKDKNKKLLEQVSRTAEATKEPGIECNLTKAEIIFQKMQEKMVGTIDITYNVVGMVSSLSVQ